MNRVIQLIFLCFYVVIYSCKEQDIEKQPILTENKQKVQLKYTKLFSIIAYDNYTEVIINNPWNLSTVFAKYALVPKEKEIPKNIPKESVLIRTPVDNVVTLASPHIGLFSALFAENRICAVGQTEYVYNSNIQNKIKLNKIKEVGVNQNLNIELLIDLSPEIIMATGNKQIHDNLALVAKYGIPVVYNIDWMEQSPLGRAEWIKFAAVFLNKNREADSLFNYIESAYVNTVEKIKLIEGKPKVLLGKKYKGTWYMAGGKSYFAEFLRDAGADYYWYSDSTTGSMPLSFEEVVDKQADVDFWLNPGTASSISELMSEDERYQVFKAFKTKQVYSNSKQITETGANGYWEAGSLNPHLILTDLMHIFHPNINPQYEMVYHQKLKE